MAILSGWPFFCPLVTLALAGPGSEQENGYTDFMDGTD